MKVTILAPAFNEELVIEQFVTTVMQKLKDKLDFELLVVNDGSTDKTGDILARLQEKYTNLSVVNHSYNRGLGSGLKTGFTHAMGDIVVTLDADLSQCPSIIPAMVAEVNKGADVVIASRYVYGGATEDVPWWRVLISKVGNQVIKRLTGIKANDCTSGMRVYRAELVKQLYEFGSGFEAQLRILYQLKNKKIKEYPLVLKNRAAGESKMRYVKLVPKYLTLLATLPKV